MSWLNLLIIEFLHSSDNDENIFYILTPKDVIVARSRTIEDRINWAIEKKYYELALKLIEQQELQYVNNQQDEIKNSFVDRIGDVGQKWLALLFLERIFCF